MGITGQTSIAWGGAVAVVLVVILGVPIVKAWAADVGMEDWRAVRCKLGRGV
jgi:hypothetical protein